MYKLFFSILLIAVSYSCVKPKDESGPNFNVVVLGASRDCEDSFVLKFDSNVTGLYDNYQNNAYVETNLNADYRVAGKTLMVTFRKPTIEERVSCNEEALIVYPQVYIISAHD